MLALLALCAPALAFRGPVSSLRPSPLRSAVGFDADADADAGADAGDAAAEAAAAAARKLYEKHAASLGLAPAAAAAAAAAPGAPVAEPQPDFNPMASLLDAGGLGLDGSPFDAPAPEPAEPLGAFDPRDSPHTYAPRGSRVGVLVVDHGSRSASSNEALEAFVEAYAARAPSGWRAAAAHMELAAPSIDDAFAALVDGGCDVVVCAPLFLGPGRHATEDVPRLFAAAAAAHPSVTALEAPYLGTAAPALADALHGLVDRTVKDAAAAPAFEDSFFGGIAAAMAAADAA